MTTPLRGATAFVHLRHLFRRAVVTTTSLADALAVTAFAIVLPIPRLHKVSAPVLAVATTYRTKVLLARPLPMKIYAPTAFGARRQERVLSPEVLIVPLIFVAMIIHIEKALLLQNPSSRLLIHIVATTFIALLGLKLTLWIKLVTLVSRLS